MSTGATKTTANDMLSERETAIFETSIRVVAMLIVISKGQRLGRDEGIVIRALRPQGSALKGTV
jgi:hypothetical protein